jgi:hypothetical protein
VQLGLTGSASTVIGTTGQDKVLSGGEKKRLAFATEVQIKQTTEGPMTVRFYFKRLVISDKFSINLLNLVHGIGNFTSLRASHARVS